jgi:hypothetical protein
VSDERRYFSLAEANSLVPTLESRFGHIMQLRAELRHAHQRLDELGEPPTAESLKRRDGGDDRVQLRGRFRALLEALTDELQAVEELGVAVKDLDIGLCDFLGRIKGRAVWLCWQYGEKQVAYWHELNAGFSGRQLIAEGDPPERLLH